MPFGRKTALALDRYLRARSRHRLAHLDALWLSQRGTLTISGLRDLLDRRARQAGIPDLHPHMFRHTFTHEWLSAGGTEVDLMRIAGWPWKGGEAEWAANGPPSPKALLRRNSDAQVLRDIRDLRGETQQTLGRQLGWSVSAVSRFEATAERRDQATHQRLPILAFGLVLSVLWTVADAVVAVLSRWWRGWRRHWRRPF